MSALLPGCSNHFFSNDLWAKSWQYHKTRTWQNSRMRGKPPGLCVCVCVCAQLLNLELCSWVMSNIVYLCGAPLFESAGNPAAPCPRGWNVRGSEWVSDVMTGEWVCQQQRKRWLHVGIPFDKSDWHPDLPADSHRVSVSHLWMSQEQNEGAVCNIYRYLLECDENKNT